MSKIGKVIRKMWKQNVSWNWKLQFWNFIYHFNISPKIIQGNKLHWPKLAWDRERNWRGNHLGCHLDVQALDEAAKTAVECYTTKTDENAIDPKTVSSDLNLFLIKSLQIKKKRYEIAAYGSTLLRYIVVICRCIEEKPWNLNSLF